MKYARYINKLKKVNTRHKLKEKNVFLIFFREWEELSPMGIARIQPGVATLGGRVYAVGGEQGSQILANGEVYDPQVTQHMDILSYILCYMVVFMCTLLQRRRCGAVGKR